MYQLDHPWLLATLPLPILVWILLPAYRERLSAVRTPFFAALSSAAGLRPQRGAVVLRRTWLQWLVAPVAWALVVVALAGPQWVEPPIERIESARDLFVAVDISESMETRDFKTPDGKQLGRFDAARAVLDDFIARRRGDRIGLIVFGLGAYLQAPLTLDHDSCLELLHETRIGMAGSQTTIGDAIGLAIRLFEKSTAPQKVLILMTDGNDTGSRVPPLKAADIAAGKGITVYTIALGDPKATGGDIVDTKALQAIATRTGGTFYLATDRQRLSSIYRELDAIQKQTFKTMSYRPKRPLFHWPLGAAMALIAAYLVVETGVSALRRWRFA
ncbi:MAG TPA: VWA domain-containing protein [Vicinamibacterales bacterium]|nr:VWA domain-containing protein [Vicinamibacterales bacterium]